MNFKNVGALCLTALLAACGGGDSAPTPVQERQQPARQQPAPAPSPTPVVLTNVLPTSTPRQADLERLRASHGLPGLSMVIIDNGTVESVATGVRTVTSAGQITPSDQFQHGSLTKAATAMLIARLVEKNKLRWNSTLAELFPAWSERMHPSLRAVTVEQVLQHRLGLKRDFDQADVNFLNGRATGNVSADRAAMVENWLQQPPALTPNTQYSYSNLGYMVATLIAETAGGGTYAALMEAEVFRPLQITASFGIPEDSGAETITGHELRNGAWVPAVYSAQLRQFLELQMGGGLLMMSLPEYGKYLQEHLKGMKGESTFLSRESYRRIHTPVDNYGLGWLVWDVEGVGRVSLHNGTITKYYTTTMIIPGENRAIAISCNCFSNDAASKIDAYFWAWAERNKTQP